jgi:hypothetical protein
MTFIVRAPDGGDPHVTVGRVVSMWMPVTGPAVVHTPLLAHTCTVFVEALAAKPPLGTEAVRVNDALAGSTSPEYVSYALQWIDTTLCELHVDGALPQLIEGGDSSILISPTGPAVAHLPRVSHTGTEFVVALALAAPGGTDAVSVNADWAGFASPDGALALQWTVTDLNDQPDVGRHDTAGGARSTLRPVTGPSVMHVPTALQTWVEFVEAFAS